MRGYRVLLFYKYIRVSDPEKFKDEHLAWCLSNNIKGRIYIASEGINGTVSGLAQDIENYKNNLRSYEIFEDIIFKEDETDEIALMPFGRVNHHIKIMDLQRQLKTELKFKNLTLWHGCCCGAR